MGIIRAKDERTGRSCSILFDICRLPAARSCLVPPVAWRELAVAAEILPAAGKTHLHDRQPAQERHRWQQLTRTRWQYFAATARTPP